MASADSGAPARVVLYDGACGMCSRSVQWIVAHDSARHFHFAPLQGPTAAEIRRRHPELPDGLDSLVLVDRSAGTERVSWESDAIFQILDQLGGRWRWLALARVLPRRLTDVGYRMIARRRHDISEALGTCPVPSEATRMRFLP
jgi:predicted DCC family thiol-disulfide oxidoreductase YuxK